MEEDDPFQHLDNVSRAYIGLHQTMMKFYEEGKHNECVQLARQLLTKANSPILIGAHCHMILSTIKGSTLAVGHAETAVELLDVKAREMVKPEEQFPQKQLDSAYKCLEVAREQAAATPAKDGKPATDAGQTSSKAAK